MPPRQTKKGVAAKKPSPRTKKFTSQPKPEATPLPILEEKEATEGAVPSVELEKVVTVQETSVTEEKVEKQNDEMDAEHGATQNIVGESTGGGVGDIIEGEDGNVDEDGDKDDDEDEHGYGMTDANEDGIEEGNGDKSGSGSEENENKDTSIFVQAPLAGDKKEKDIEIFVGGLDKEAVEEDVIEVFSKFGEIKSVRIAKQPTTQKSKGFAFIQYATIDQAKKALTDLKDGIEVKGKRVSISVSQDNDTIYVGNICKTWTKEQVLETLKSLGIEQLEVVQLPNDPKNEGKNRGFALLLFTSHSDAIVALQRLRQPDAIFGSDRSAKVAFAQLSIRPSEEAVSQVKTVFLEGLSDSWDEEKLKELCQQYGEIENVKLSRDFVSTKRRDYGFVLFTSRESALSCVEGINKDQIGGDSKVKANLAKPQHRGRLAKQVTSGGYRVKDSAEESGPLNKKDHAKSKGAKGKGKGKGKGKAPLKSRGPSASIRSGGTGHRRIDQSARGGNPGTRPRSIDTSAYGRSAKRSRGNSRDRSAHSFGNKRNKSDFGNLGQNYATAPAVYTDPYYQVYSAPAHSYQGPSYGARSGSKRHHADMETRGVYLEPAIRKQGQGQYEYQLRAGRYDGQSSSGSAYGGGSLLPPSYLPQYASYPGLKDAAGSGYGYPSSGLYPPRQSYY